MSERPADTARTALAIGLSAAVVAALWYLTLGRGAPPGGQAGLAVAPEPAASAPGAGTAAAPAPEAPAAGPAPSFDVVRVSPDGQAIVAGRAAPGATVTIYADDAPLATVEAEPSGEFVAIFRAEPSVSPRSLTLDAAEGGGPRVPSEDVVVLLPPAAPPPPGDGAADTVPAEAPPGDPAAAPDDAETAGDAAAETGDASVAASAVLRPDAPAEVQPSAARRSGQVTISSISYADRGGVTLAGLAEAGASVRAYVDDSFAESAVADDKGQWILQLDGVAAGVYRLRIDALGDDGRVASRVETPFQRDFPEVAEPGAERPVTVTVQPGNNLWTLARSHYGQGVLYTKIYTANAELIRDPDLIYPGQIFDLPEYSPGEAPAPEWRPGDGPLSRP